MPKTTYFAGSSIPIAVAVTNSTGAVNPTSATITIRDSRGTILENATAMVVTANECTFTLAASKTGLKGSYTFEVAIIMPTGNTVTWRVTKQVE